MGSRPNSSPGLGVAPDAGGGGVDLLEGLKQVSPVLSGAGDGRLSDDGDESSEVGGFGERADGGGVGGMAALGLEWSIGH